MSHFFATCAKGLERLLVQELEALGAESCEARTSGVTVQGSLETAYRVCLWSRVASRVLWPLTKVSAPDTDTLYSALKTFPWEEHFTVDKTFAVHCTALHAPISNTHFAALRVKDAVVDRFRDFVGRRPNVDPEAPDLRIAVHLQEETAQVYLDLSGASLHRRGYRQESGPAPLKETLAAAVLKLAEWPTFAQSGNPLLDPMCGSGTLVLEAALMAADWAPGLLRRGFGFEAWRHHDRKVWFELALEAKKRKQAGLARMPQLLGYDSDGTAIRTALEARDRLGLAKQVHFERRDLDRFEVPDSATGLVVANPPYGERLGTSTHLMPLYAHLGTQLKRYCGGWRAGVLTSDPELGHALGMRADQQDKLFNGAIPCVLYGFAIHQNSEAKRASSSTDTNGASQSIASGPEQMFVNRLHKNLRHLKKWREQQDIHCFRAYDADLREYNVAVDLYEDWAVLQEYQAPDSVDTTKAQQRLRAVVTSLPEALGISPSRVILKVRARQGRSFRYTAETENRQFLEVREGDLRFLVNFTDTIDTGLFLDHRLTRQWLRERARGQRFLNLFGYTGTASVAAAKGGASATTTVDLSPRFLEWSDRNLALNGFHGNEHRLQRSDCLEWLKRGRGDYELIFLDPPTFSHSKRAHDFAVQRDHLELIRLTMQRLAPEGVLLFTNHFRQFKLEPELLDEFAVENLHPHTVPKDFSRTPKVHWAWAFRHR